MKSVLGPENSKPQVLGLLLGVSGLSSVLVWLLTAKPHAFSLLQLSSDEDCPFKPMCVQTYTHPDFHLAFVSLFITSSLCYACVNLKR
jgi:hypothetical protein